MCKITAAMIQADGKAVGTALDNLAAVLQASDPTVATDLKGAGDAVIAATANWQDGTSITIIEDAETAAIAVLNAIPLTSPYAPLVAIAFTALNILLANAQTQSSQTGNAIADAHMILTRAAKNSAGSPWAGKAVIKHHFLNPPRKDFESAWNAAGKPLGMPALTV